ncbi:hypothetical protein LOTGIDRAFT_173396 [Lottia gigantea]|uniref:Fibrinogen C-terminal domain-containing protein n=1 Tax=Lottia gigantea TaxID=225164 RepID=V4AYI8_LOTGI|nr:hypothetical protein LOTGIDRAFT_173396 [Lottia gigantea]ESP00161.1 hypothetical protein LOTGIDRAFT_173396 [Lottia gigantea]
MVWFPLIRVVFLISLLFMELIVADNSVTYLKTDVRVIDCDLNPQLASRNTTTQLGCSIWCSKVEECERYKFCPFSDGKSGGECVLHTSHDDCLSQDVNHTCVCMIKKSLKYGNGTYTCQSGFYGSHCENIVKDCTHASEIPEMNDNAIKLMFVQPTLATKPFQIYCRTAPKPLVLVSLRMYSSVCCNLFNKSWAEYRDGFGSLLSGYWLGLQKLYLLVNEPGRNASFQVVVRNSLLTCVNLYSELRITDEDDGFRISLGRLSNVTDMSSCQEGMRQTNLEAEGQPFSTYDRYNGSYNCPEVMQSGWWFAENSLCTSTNVNGDFKFSGRSSISWLPDFNVYAVTFVEITIR